MPRYYQLPDIVMASLASQAASGLVAPSAAEAESREAKRARTPAPLAQPALAAIPEVAQPPRSSFDVEGLLATHSATILANTASLLRSYDKQVQARFSEVERDMARVSSAQDQQSAKNDALWTSIARLQAGLAVAEELVPPTTAPCYGPDFDRQVDTTIIKVNLAVDVARSLVQDALLAALTAAAGDAWKLEGPDCGQRFVV